MVVTKSLATAIEEALRDTRLAPVAGSDEDLRPLAHLLADAVVQWQTEYGIRPAFPPHAQSVEREVVGDGCRLILRQVGWHGQTGALYSYFDNPRGHEPGSYSPMWVVAHADRLADLAPDGGELRVDSHAVRIGRQMIDDLGPGPADRS